MRIGTRIGGYRVEQEIARGSMSTVYAAVDEADGSYVALKLLAPWVGEDDAYRAALLDDLRLWAELDHPNVLAIYEGGEEGGRPYVVLQLVDGPDLHALVRHEGPLPVERALRLLDQAAAGLEAAHATGLVHRDVQARRLLVERGSDHLWVTGFGFVRDGLPPGAAAAEHASPEQRAGRPATVRTDVYGLGCVLCELLTGVPPWGDVAALVTLPAELEPVLARATAPAPSRRYATPGALARAARKAVEGHPATAAAPAVAAAAAVAAAPPEVVPQPAPEGAPPVVAATAAEAPIRAVVAPAPARAGIRRATAVALIVLAVVVAAVAGLVLRRLTSDSSSSGTRTAATGPGTDATSTRSLGAAEALRARLGLAGVRDSCSKATHPGGIATLLCSTHTPQGLRIDLHVDQFGSERVVRNEFREEALGTVQRRGGLEVPVGRTAGRCDGLRWLGSGVWRVGAARHGLVACAVALTGEPGCRGLGAARCSVLFWSYEPQHVYVRAAVPGEATAGLYRWWHDNRAGFLAH